MKPIYIIFLFFVISISAYAQDKYDHTWILGYTPNKEENGGIVLRFTHETVDTAYFNIALKLTSANGQICTSEGEPLFYTNSCRMARYPNRIIENSDSLNNLDGLREFWCEYDYYNTDQGIVTLPWPDRPGHYGVFHLSWLRYQQFPTIDWIDKLYFTHVDMTANSGDGLVREKNQVVLADTFIDNLTAVRHGNGRDWWLVQPRRGTDTLFLFLFQPDGVRGPFVQETGLRLINFLYTAGQAVFSPDGTRYILLNAGVDVLSFDRCRGVFTCPLRLRLPGHGGPSGVSVAPGGRYLYVSNNTELYQYDLWAKDLESSKIFIAEYDGFVDLFPATFYQHRLAPNGKIYLSATNSQRHLHVIHQPDSAGQACDFRQHDLALPAFSGVTLPNFPHFRLYDLPFSPCDTAGVDAPPGYEVLWIPSDGIRLLPNPASGPVSVTLPPCANGELRVYTTAGVLMQKHPVRCEKQYTIDTSDLPAGIYIVSYAPAARSRPLSAKLVVAR